MKPILADGRTESGRHLLVRGGLSPGYGDYEVIIDGQPWEVVKTSRLRDGGTTFVDVELRGVAARITFPARIGSDDRTPRLDGERVEAGEPSYRRALEMIASYERATLLEAGEFQAAEFVGWARQALGRTDPPPASREVVSDAAEDAKHAG